MSFNLAHALRVTEEDAIGVLTFTVTVFVLTLNVMYDGSAEPSAYKSDIEMAQS